MEGGRENGEENGSSWASTLLLLSGSLSSLGGFCDPELELEDENRICRVCRREKPYRQLRHTVFDGRLLVLLLLLEKSLAGVVHVLPLVDCGAN